VLGFSSISALPLSSLGASIGVNLGVGAVLPIEVWTDGGEQITLVGTFTLSQLTVAISVNGTEYPCYSGVAGQGYAPIPRSTSSFAVVAPRLPVGGPYTVVVRQGIETAVLPDAIRARNHFFRDRIHQLRQLSPPFLRSGARRLDLEPPLPVDVLLTEAGDIMQTESGEDLFLDVGA
jgi:hypothetical protein